MQKLLLLSNKDRQKSRHYRKKTQHFYIKTCTILSTLVKLLRKTFTNSIAEFIV